MREQSFMKSLFFGVIDESLIFPWPEPQGPEVDRIHALLDSTRRFFELRVDSAAIDREHRIPEDVLGGCRSSASSGWRAAEPRRHAGSRPPATPGWSRS